MSLLFKPAAALVLVFGSLGLLDFAKTKTFSGIPQNAPAPAPPAPAPKIQVAVLLDVSNSMDGLIDQAKAQLWNMVSVMGKAECNNVNPQIEIALYEYGRSNNDKTQGYIRQINGFITDLDQLSKNLFSLTTNGGDEFCGHVMYRSLTEMQWDTAASSYKVIFIAGNEDFLQGDISFSKACAEASRRNVVVNTIYCGDRQQGIAEHWNLGGECGLGSYTNINQDAKVDDPPTPYDSTLFVLNDQLNRTYIGYGSAGVAGYSKQAEVDQMNMAYSRSANAKRVAVKGKTKLYDNRGWDLVDANKADSTAIEKVDNNTLPENLRKLNKQELRDYVDNKSKERAQIQQEILAVSAKREQYIAAERTRNAAASNNPTLQTEIERIIRAQATRYNMTIR